MNAQIQTFLKVILFSLGLVGLYTGFANMLPQVKSSPPEPEMALPVGEMSMGDFIALGEKLFSGKGTCTLCHNAMGRAPDLLAINAVESARKALADGRYQGNAKNEEDYIRESMTDPSAYVVAGFGVKGSNDAKSPMPAVHKAPLSLSETGINALIAFLQSKDGGEITVPLPGAEAVEDPQTAEDETGPAETAEAALNKFMCTGCHEVLDSPGGVGPSFKTIGARRSAEQIRRDILEPDAVIADGFEGGMMPPDFDAQMTVRELELIVHFLAESK